MVYQSEKMRYQSTLKMKKICFVLLGMLMLLSMGADTHAQIFGAPAHPGRADSLRGYLGKERICFDVRYYHLTVEPDLDKKLLKGVNLIKFDMKRPSDVIQIDLFSDLKVDSVMYGRSALETKREGNAVSVRFPKVLAAGSHQQVSVFYSGKPREAKNAPWDGGVVFDRDRSGRPFVATACQGIGASLWWPNKDHQSDEPDSMMISIVVPADLCAVSNGRLRSVVNKSGRRKEYNWVVQNPINNYGVTMNIGNYVELNDRFSGERGNLDISYWVLKEDKEKALKHFDENVKPMLSSFEHWFGPYPFYEDGYKLVQTPFLGMEHQSAIAYGNNFLNGYRGTDLSGTGWGSKWDFIIVHESGHEWFGNNITANDIADMWVHESFTNYSESLFIESRYGKEAAAAYIKGLRGQIQNDIPIIGQYGINKEGSGDMYYKGANMLHMLRVILSNDANWRDILRGLNKEFYHRAVDGSAVINYINKKAGVNFNPIFNQYLKHVSIPVLEINERSSKLFVRWIAEAEDFNMPVRIRVGSGAYRWIKPTRQFTLLDVPASEIREINVDTDNFYIGVLKTN